MQNISTDSIVDSDFLITKAQNNKYEQFMSWLFKPFYTPKPSVAVLRLNGVIGKIGMKPGLNLESLNELIEKVFEIKNLKALCLSINSPGGSPVQSELIAKRIRSLALEHKVPIYSFVEDVAASGGYWLACIGDEIYASKSSIIGSIGVIASGFGFQKAIERLGIERRIYSQGKNKSILDPFVPVQKTDVIIVRNIQKQIHQHFISYIKERRGGKLTQDDNILFNGEFWAGESALDFGLIDGIGDMYSVIKSKFGDIKIQNITAKQSWFQKKLAISSENFASDISTQLINSVEQKLMNDKYDLR